NVVYNAENRPVTFTSEDGATVVECTYDYMGRRHTRKITVNGSVTNYLRYIYRGYLQIAAINAVSGVFQWFILWDPTQPVATRPLGIRKDGTWYTYGWDLTKNICEVFGSDGYIKTAYTYTPYGAVTATGNVTQPIQWSSEYNDSELGLDYYNYRHYNPADGRWTGRDMDQENSHPNVYDFVEGQVLISIDFLGLRNLSRRSRRFSKNENGINCIGYATGLNVDLQPNDSSLMETFRSLHWRCRDIKYHEKCQGTENQDVMVVFIHVINEATINGKFYATPEEIVQYLREHHGGLAKVWNKRRFWGRDPIRNLVDFHGVKKERNCSAPGKEWSYVPCRFVNKPAKSPVMYTSDPNTTSSEASTLAKYCCTKERRSRKPSSCPRPASGCSE
ncbi:MAG TPA: hypothetical protein H9976_08040, partial [Candidatus Akkermansia intestinavium]|nr:hypothetical protein [Candidatus Akkermansia intestinavium]